MRIAVTPKLSTKDGESNKNARMTNALVEKNPTGAIFGAVRPGVEVIEQHLTPKTGQGIVEFSGKLFSIYEGDLEEANTDALPVESYPSLFTIDDLLEYANPNAFITSICNGADVQGYSDIVACGWGVGPNTTQGWEWQLYIFRWEEVGFQILDIAPTAYIEEYDWKGVAVMSNDGKVIFTQGITAEDEDHSKIFKWTERDGMVLLGPDPSVGHSSTSRTRVSKCTPSGDSCIGQFYSLSGSLRAFVWNEADGFVDAGSTYTTSMARDISYDGNYFVGYYETGGVRYAGRFNVTTKTWENLGSLGAGSSEAMFVSANGGVVVGLSAGKMFKWTSLGGMVEIATGIEYILGMSRDGSTVVGRTSAGHSFKWTEYDGVVDLSWPSEASGYATSVSEFGDCVVGYSVGVAPSNITHSWKWTAKDGLVATSPIEESSDYFNHHVSPDGSAIAGAVGYRGGLLYTGIDPTLLGGTNVLPRFRSLASLEGDFFDFIQSTI